MNRENTKKQEVIISIGTIQQQSSLQQNVNMQKQMQIEIENLKHEQVIRKILRSGHISAKNVKNSILKIQHMGLDIIISNDHDLQYITRGQLLNLSPIVLSLIINSPQQIKQQIVFNEHGDKLSEEIALNEPSDSRYMKKVQRKKQQDNLQTDNQTIQNQQKQLEIEEETQNNNFQDDNIICAFCKESVNNLECIKKLGWFYGPYKNKNKTYYVHLMCAIWSPAVYINEKTNRMMNIKKEIARSNKLMCKECGLLGGGLGCTIPNCKQSYHFKCGLSEKLETRLDHSTYELYCPTHASILDDKVLKEIDNFHCEVCQIDQNEELILLCDECNKAFHTYCLPDKLQTIPDHDWYCPTCIIEKPYTQIKNGNDGFLNRQL